MQMRHLRLKARGVGISGGHRRLAAALYGPATASRGSMIFVALICFRIVGNAIDRHSITRRTFRIGVPRFR
jgi:hypothetical protein